MEPAPVSEELPDPLILYDGVCGLCHRYVQRMLSWDRDGVFMFAALQGETVDALRTRYDSIPETLDTVVLIEGGEVYVRSRAVLRAMRHLPMPWRALSWLRMAPAPIADLAYRAIAVNRYRLFGEYDSCRLPSEAEAARFLP